MKRLIQTTALGLTAAVAVGGIGCVSTGDKPSIDDRYAKYVDPCYPERYTYTARQEVLAPFAVQVANAEVFDLTVWNSYFVPGTDTLNSAGQEKLNYMVHRRPAPDARIFVQTARDIEYDATKPEKFVMTRQELDSKRQQSVLRYVGVQTAGRPFNPQVQVIDPAPNSIRSDVIAGASRGLQGRYTAAGGGSTPVAGGGTVTSNNR